MPKHAPEKAKSSVRVKFFELLFGDDEGWLCIATSHPELPKATFKQFFFEWPRQFNILESFILQNEPKLNIYFCVNLLSRQERRKENCLPGSIIWADLDTVNPDALAIPPGITVQSSPGRWQAYWKLDSKLQPYQAEIYSRRVAYAVSADKSGWDLTQLLRVPLTRNWKYRPAPMIMIERAMEVEAQPILFDALPDPDVPMPPGEQAMPNIKELPSVEHVLYKYAINLSNTPFKALYTQEPQADEDWSKILWRLIHVCFEAGMRPEEVLSVTASSSCNKYGRDGRPITDLWRDISKAREQQEKFNIITGTALQLEMPQLVEEKASETFIDQYRSWAQEATDAVVAFHDLSAFMLLSSIVANSVRLNTSYGPIVPNLWGLLLGDSTLTRKTTAMKMVIDFIVTMDKDMIVATDGTAEGLLTGLATRPNRTSIFYKDEISGFFDSINRKDYLAGMPETLTALYDVPAIFSRRLRKESITIENPAFVFFGGGVKSRVYETITEEYIYSGFIPRFLIVTGETDIARLRRTGPPEEIGLKKRSAIMAKVSDVYESYAADVTVNIGGQKARMPARVTANLTQDAWEKYGEIEDKMVNLGNESTIPDLALPTFERLTRSMLKMGVILAAERQMPDKDGQIKVEESDIINAAWYVQDWGRYSIDLVTNAGNRMSEKMLNKAVKVIEKHPGILRSTIMRHYKLSKREADDVLITLEERGIVRKEQAGRGFKYWVV
jgi:hypothetical protein